MNWTGLSFCLLIRPGAAARQFRDALPPLGLLLLDFHPTIVILFWVLNFLSRVFWGLLVKKAGTCVFWPKNADLFFWGFLFRHRCGDFHRQAEQANKACRIGGVILFAHNEACHFRTV